MSREFHHPRLVPFARYRWDRIRKQHQIVFPEGVLLLNETAAAIVRLCDGRSLRQLVMALQEQFPDSNPSEDTLSFLERLAQKGLLFDDPNF
jgi:pyrroloquinoline quinone biosynthesis protein D